MFMDNNNMAISLNEFSQKELSLDLFSCVYNRSFKNNAEVIRVG